MSKRFNERDVGKTLGVSERNAPLLQAADLIRKIDALLKKNDDPGDEFAKLKREVRLVLKTILIEKTSGYGGSPRRYPTRFITAVSAFLEREDQFLSIQDIAETQSEITGKQLSDPAKSAASLMSAVKRELEKMNSSVALKSVTETKYGFTLKD